MTRKLTVIFLSTQIVGEIFAWILPHVTGLAGPWLWVASVILLLPGDLIATWIVEKFLWTSGLNAIQLQCLKTVFEIALNAGLWLLIARQWMHFRTRPGRRSAENPGS